MTNVARAALYLGRDREDDYTDMCHVARNHHHQRQGASRLTREDRQRDFVQRASKFGMAFMLCIGIWMLSGFSGVWPLWVLLIGGFVLAKEARDAYGGGFSDRDDADPPTEDREPVLQ